MNKSLHVSKCSASILTHWLRIGEGIGAGVLLLMSGLVVANAMSRKLLNSPLPYTLEIVGFWLMPLIVLLPLGSAYILRHHFVATLLTDLTRPRARQVCLLVASVVGTVVIAILLIGTVEGTWQSVRIGQTAVSADTIAIWPVKVCVVLALLTLLVVLAVDVHSRLRHFSEGSQNG